MTFSKKFGYVSPPPVRFRQDAPEGLRFAIIEAAYQQLSYQQIRKVICQTLYIAPDRGNWSEVPNIRDEVYRTIDRAEWYRVYDIAERLLSFIEGTYGYDAAVEFAEQVNHIFVDLGAGWQFKAGEGIVMRGDANFEETVQDVRAQLIEQDIPAAERELSEALADISRRPDPDLTGAIHHALGAMEVTARRVSGSEKGFGDVVKQMGIPKPLDEALSKMWGYSSQYGRHVSEIKQPTYKDALLTVHLASACCQYFLGSTDN